MFYIQENIVKQLLDWNEVYEAVASAMLSVSRKTAVQTPRTLTTVPGKDDILFTMPGYLEGSTASQHYSALGCKLVTSFPGNAKSHGLPSILANILLFNQENGKLQAVIEGTEITSWRTAAASVVATKYLRKNKIDNQILAIVGCGVQANIHAVAFQYFFGFEKINIWGRNVEKASKLKNELENSVKGEFVVFENLKECVCNADVIITTTYSTVPLIKFDWLKTGFHINAVGAGSSVMELDLATYTNSDVYVDHLSGVEHELNHLTKLGVTFKAEIGNVINNNEVIPHPNQNTIFESLGMAVEDCAVAKMIFQKYLQNSDILQADAKTAITF